MNIELVVTIIGFSGMAVVLFAFLMNQARKWSTESLTYDSVNLLGSALLMFYSLYLKSYPILTLNTIWAIFSARDMLIDIRDGKRKKDKPKARIGHKAR